MSAPNEQPSLEQRVIALEERAAYADKLIEDLNEVLTAAQRRIDLQEQTIAHMKQLMQRVGDSLQEKRTLEDDKPPHY